MKTRIISGILLVSAAAALTSCHDDLNITQPSQFTSRSMWTEENDAQTAVNGMFSQLRSQLSEGLSVWGDLRSNLYKSGEKVNDAFFNRVGTNVLVANDAGTNWAGLYTTINSANLILKHTPAIGFTKEADKNDVLAQAHFVRAYCYYTIVRTWGKAPLLTTGFESENQSDMYPSRDSEESLYNQIESDIEAAVKLIAPGKKLHKANIAAVNMLAADFYLWKAARLGGGKSYAQKALDAINVVFKQGYELLPNWSDIFKVSNENNNEFILTFPYTVGENVTAGTSPNFFAYFPAPMADAARLAAEGFSPDYIPTGSHAQYLVATPDYISFLLSDPTDVRGAATVRTYDEDYIKNSVQVSSVIIKFLGTWANSTRSFDNDMPLYRLAEAYLLKAEALNALDRQSDAMAELNVVAKRARGVDNFYKNLDKDGVTKAIIDETKMEFCAEGKMWWLYLRTNTEFKYISTLVGREGEKNVTLWPVENACINTNPNIDQTEGYK